MYFYFARKGTLLGVLETIIPAAAFTATLRNISKWRRDKQRKKGSFGLGIWQDIIELLMSELNLRLLRDFRYIIKLLR